MSARRRSGRSKERGVATGGDKIFGPRDLKERKRTCLGGGRVFL